MSIEKRIERLEAILDARGLDWDHPRVEEGPANEPPKKWRILEVGEVVQEGDRVTAKTNPPSDPPNGLGWRPVDASVGTSVFQDDTCIFARPVSDEPAKEPQHPAGPKPDPGEGYRLLSKDPPEELARGDEFEGVNGEWIASCNARSHGRQAATCWYRHKIEPPKPPKPEYRGRCCLLMWARNASLVVTVKNGANFCWLGGKLTTVLGFANAITLGLTPASRRTHDAASRLSIGGGGCMLVAPLQSLRESDRRDSYGRGQDANRMHHRLPGGGGSRGGWRDACFSRLRVGSTGCRMPRAHGS